MTINLFLRRGLISMILILCFIFSKAQNAKLFYAEAEKLMSTKQYNLAIDNFDKAINLDILFSEAYVERGIAYKNIGNYTLSIKDFKKAISIDTNNTPSIIQIIEPLARLHNFSDATKYYNLCLAKNISAKIDLDSWKFFSKYAESISAFIYINNYEAALKSLNDAEDLYHNKIKNKQFQNSKLASISSVLVLKGYVLEKLNRNQEAKQIYADALSINKMQPDVTVALQHINNELEKSKRSIIQKDTTAPIIEIIEPILSASRDIGVEADKTADTKLHIRGQAFDPGGINKILLNDVPLKIEEHGYFETVQTIVPGINTFSFVAFDNSGNKGTKTFQITAKANQNNSAMIVQTPIYPSLEKAGFYAILIAESNYKLLPDDKKHLPGTVNDLHNMYNVLVNKYSFPPENIDTLMNADRENIMEKIYQRKSRINENDNLLIFYAGHGLEIIHDDKTKEGFLIPVDASIEQINGVYNENTFISNYDLLNSIRDSKAKHILFIVDACYAGILLQSVVPVHDKPEPFEEAYESKSRKLVASTKDKPVPDSSLFIKEFTKALQNNSEPYISTEQLLNDFKNKYNVESGERLQYQRITGLDKGGHFVFKMNKLNKQF